MQYESYLLWAAQPLTEVSMNISLICAPDASHDLNVFNTQCSEPWIV